MSFENSQEKRKNMSIQFRDLKAQYNNIKEEMDNAILNVISESSFINGRQVDELEKKLADYVGVNYCVTCGNGTDALTMVMMAWNIKEGDAVFVPDFTFFSSGETVSFVGATPVFYDVCADTYNADVNSLEKAIQMVIAEGKLTPKAIIAVDLFGQPADYPEIEHIAKKYGLPVLEDGAQGFGGKIGDRRACSFGDVATTSFFPAKPLGCYGDGGAIFTNDIALAQYLKSIRVHGKGENKYDNVRIGMNSRLDTIQAAILQVKFDIFKNYELDKVNQIAQKYTVLLKDVVSTPLVQKEFYSSWAQYTVRFSSVEMRDYVQQYMKTSGIPTMIYYPKPLHQQIAFEGVKSFVPCGITETLCDTVLSLPIHPYLSDEDIKIVTNTLKRGMDSFNEKK